METVASPCSGMGYMADGVYPGNAWMAGHEEAVERACGGACRWGVFVDIGVRTCMYLEHLCSPAVSVTDVAALDS